MLCQISGIILHSFVDGPGTRLVVFFQGCPHNCPGCQNPDSHDIHGGMTMPISDIAKLIRETKYLDGITLSGGDPLLQPEAVIQIADAAHEMGLNVWCYTGWTLENVPKTAREALNHIDILVDGPYLQDRPPTMYRGSDNQRIIDMKHQMLLKNDYWT